MITLAKRSHKILARLRMQFTGNKSGIAAIEFALIFPMMMLLFFGTVEIGDTLYANRKVSNAANVFADLASQEQYLTHTELSGMYTAVTEIIEPYGIDDAEMWIAGITIDANKKPIIDWSIDHEMNEKFTRGTIFKAIPNKDLRLKGNAQIIHPGQSIIVTYIEYDFKSSLANVMVDGITFKRHAARWPRRALAGASGIIYCDKQKKCSDDDDD